MMTMGRELVNGDGLVRGYQYIAYFTVVGDGGEDGLNNKKEINSTDNRYN